MSEPGPDGPIGDGDGPIGDGDRLAALTADPLSFFADPDDVIRRLAVSVSATLGPAANAAVAERLRQDDSPSVRAEAAEVLGGFSNAQVLLEAVGDPEPVVLEAIATALGEIGDDAAVPWLLDATAAGNDKLLREAAVAALGAIGDERARPLLVELAGSGPPQIRRRAVVALTAFDGEGVEHAIRSALSDRNPMVREVAEMVMGRPEDWHGVELQTRQRPEA